MLSFPAAHERAIQRAIDTGTLAEMDFIHSVQQAEGVMPCFGRMEDSCRNVTCRWYGECMLLVEARNVAHEPMFT